MPKQGLYEQTTEHDACGVGFVVDIKGRKSHGLIDDALCILKNLIHRGACGYEENTGDGVGILLQIPHKFYKTTCQELEIPLPDIGGYGVGIVFLPRDSKQRTFCKERFAEIIAQQNQSLIGWRTLPTDDNLLGKTALKGKPEFEQVFIRNDTKSTDPMVFERQLYVIRKRIEHLIAQSDLTQKGMFYIPSLSSRIVIYKGMLTGSQLEPMFPDIVDQRVESAIALVHQRFSTNTLPSWPLAQPFRYIAHNGEINTVRGNSNWMYAREAFCQSDLLKEDLQKILPIITEENSDSATFDNVMEFLHMTGRSLPHSVLMMIPEAWSKHQTMDEKRKAFYEYHACLMEPWDGPASIAFTDGECIGAVLDRNGLRPSRYYVTYDGKVIMASEVGVLDIPPESVKIKERLHPGKIFMVDTKAGRIIDDDELKDSLAKAYPYADWLAENLISLSSLTDGKIPPYDGQFLKQHQVAFGYTREDLHTLIQPMAEKGQEPIGSMGSDTPLAVLSNRPRLLFDYFKQLFAQVTNPPLDGIREELVTQIETTIGPEGDLLCPTAESCQQIKIASPILTNQELAKLNLLNTSKRKSQRLSICYPLSDQGASLEQALDNLFHAADAAIAENYQYLILTDRQMDEKHIAIPSLLAVSGLHHHLIKNGTRTQVALIIESAEPREVHHFAILIGYGAGAINPYLAFESLTELKKEGYLNDQVDDQEFINNYIKAINKGLVKTLSKMGISTIQSYHGGQIFEAIGIDKSIIDRYFTKTTSRIGGLDLDTLAKEKFLQHRRAFPTRSTSQLELNSGGEYGWRRDGEYHLFNPNTVFKLQHATRTGQYKIFKEYTALVDNQSKNLATLRGLFEFKPTPIPLDQVEPISQIIKRFSTGAMSYGSISKEAHETLAIAMNHIGGKSNTGEGGEDAARYTPDKNGDLKRSAIKQVASGRFGVTSEYLVNADDIQIKIAQGAKPGEGGQLPGDKVYPWIAKVRHSTPGVGLISPPPHHDIYSIEDLAQLIYDLKNANQNARIHVKLVAEVGVGTIAAGVAKAHADVILISGYDGGTGASPLSSLKHTGLPWELGLAETQQVLVQQKLRDRVCVQTDGQLKTGRDVVIAALLGAEEFSFSTAPLVVEGCIMMRVCHLNTCPVGIATQNPKLRKKFTGKPEFVENFFKYIAEEVREYMAILGFRTIDEMIGRIEKLDMKTAIYHWKAKNLDLSPILHTKTPELGTDIRCTRSQNHGLNKSLDVTKLWPLCKEAIENKKPIWLTSPIRNIHRTVGTIVGAEISRRYGAKGLAEDTINIHFAGSAGMSFGAFLPKGMSLTLEGDANDYLGKGLSGGKIIVFPPKAAKFIPEENILIGNVILYGATNGEAYFRGIAGERFCVRNSGVHAVVEGVGDHGCEYMTGGRVVILGATGRNFAAGMSGGIAYVYDKKREFSDRCNQDMVEIESITSAEDIELLHTLLTKHLTYTGSSTAASILENWQNEYTYFAKVMPIDYKRALAEICQQEQVAHG